MLSPGMTIICWFSQLPQAYSCSRGLHISHCFPEVEMAFEFLPVVTVTITYFWDVTSYYVDRYARFEETALLMCSKYRGVLHNST